MLYPSSPLFDRLLERINRLPVIDCHEHLVGPEARTPYKEPIASLIEGYVFSDLQSAGFGIPDRDLARLEDQDVSTDEKWPLFEKLWQATEHTAYARVTKLVLQNVYGEGELTREALDRVAEQLPGQDEAAYFRAIDEAGIEAMIVDVLDWLPDGLGSFLNGRKRFPDKWRPMISLPGLHPTNLTWEVIERVGQLADRHITSLDEYLEAVFVVFGRCVERGCVGIKDQSAYNRILAYDLVPRADAERQFNRVLGDPRNSLGWPEGKPLNDYLFHQYMRFARDLGLPVQVHTGHMAGIRNRVDKTNAAYLASVLEVHRDVCFDLFHGNWPYLGDLQGARLRRRLRRLPGVRRGSSPDRAGEHRRDAGPPGRAGLADRGGGALAGRRLAVQQPEPLLQAGVRGSVGVGHACGVTVRGYEATGQPPIRRDHLRRSVLGPDYNRR